MLAFSRGELTCLVNLDCAEAVPLAGEVVLASEPDVTSSLPRDTAAWLRTEGAR